MPMGPIKVVSIRGDPIIDVDQNLDLTIIDKLVFNRHHYTGFTIDQSIPMNVKLNELQISSFNFILAKCKIYKHNSMTLESAGNL